MSEYFKTCCPVCDSENVEPKIGTIMECKDCGLIDEDYIFEDIVVED